MPIYKHPNFVSKLEDYRVESENKRYWLELTINSEKSENLIVIMKNPSRATKEVSDKTVFNVTNYINANSNAYTELKNIGKIVILNLIPLYETYSAELVNSGQKILDKKNLEIIDNYCSKNSKVIIAWGNHPNKLRKEYDEIKNEVFKILNKNKNELFYVQSISKLGNPKHGQVWSYANELKKYK